VHSKYSTAKLSLMDILPIHTKDGRYRTHIS
jgi:hypothetical protein